MEESGIYGIVDCDVCARFSLDPVETGAAFFRAELPWVQLRAKGFGDREKLRLAEKLASHPNRTVRTRFVLNDRADLATLAGADGVHVGQGDLPPASIRKLHPHLGVGFSTHTPDELEAALSEDLAYVAWGPVFSTNSKKNHEPVVGEASLAKVRELTRKAGRKLVVIGGIDESRISAVAPFTDYVAMISALVDGANFGTSPFDFIEARARSLSMVFLEAKKASSAPL